MIRKTFLVHYQGSNQGRQNNEIQSFSVLTYK